MTKLSFSHTVSAPEVGQRLDQFLASRLDDISRSQIQKLIEEGQVLLNGATAKKRHILEDGDLIIVNEREERLRLGEAALPQEMALDILYEDDSLIVLNKPAGLVVHPGNGNRDGTLVNGLLFHTADLSEGSAPDRPGIVHRLDKDTSGVMVTAKTTAAHAALAQQFGERSVEKFYIGICIGNPPAEHAIIDQPLGRSNRDPLRRAVLPNGKPAQTEYWVLHHESIIAVLRFCLHTGRTHQVRAHCSHINMPIVADRLYGGGRDRILLVQPLERPFAHSIFKCFDRHALHAQTLTFNHPVTKERMSFTAEPPSDFRKALSLFNKPIVL